jgi:hypothetical protein
MFQKPVLLLVVLFTAVGCASLGNPFLNIKPDYSKVPEEELRALAQAVEKSVAQGEREPALNDYPSIKMDSEEVKQAIRTRAARAHLVQELLNTGFAYEQKSSTIATIRSREYKQATNSRKRDQDALLVMSENANRWALYEGLVKASNWSPGALGAVQDAFFQARVEILSPGQKYEGPKGETLTK